MGDRVNFYPFHIGDYAVHTRHLTLMEDLAYRRLLDLYYTREKPLPNDEQEVARLIGMREQVAEVNSVLAEFFDNCGDGWFHDRCDAEIAKMHAKQQNARASVAKRSANAPATQALRERDASVIDASTTNTNTNTKEREPRATRLASDWKLPADWGIWAERERPDLNPLKTAERFADYWRGKPGKDGRKLDWEATWRNWVRDERAPKANPADVARVTVPFKASPNSALEQMKRDVMTPEQEAAAEAARLAVMAKLKPIKAAA
jgi:uncharacterized protein YdaU (DUF1376 family)